MKVKKTIKHAMPAALLMASILLILYSAYSLYNGYKMKQQEAAEYKDIRCFLNITLITEEPNEHLSAGVHDKSGGHVQSDEHAESNEPLLEKKFIYDWESLRLINDDIAGWIYIPESEINYPVVKGTDNSFYLSHSFKKEKNRSGCLFLDYKSDSLHDNQVIYGHNMGAGRKEMFSTLIKWEDDRWYRGHSIIYYTPLSQDTQAYSVFAVLKTYVKDMKERRYIVQEFVTQSDFTDWVTIIKGKSIYDTNVTPQYGSKIMTFLTCDRRDYGPDGRLIIFVAAKDG